MLILELKMGFEARGDIGDIYTRPLVVYSLISSGIQSIAEFFWESEVPGREQALEEENWPDADRKSVS